jgi:hypothetical protein
VLSLIHTLYSSLQHALSLLSLLSANGLQWCSFLSFSSSPYSAVTATQLTQFLRNNLLAQSQSQSYFLTFILATSPLRPTTSSRFFNMYGYNPYVTPLFTTAASPCLRSHSWVQVLWDSWPYFTVPDLKLPQPGGLGPCICTSQEQRDPVTHRGTGFPYDHFLWLEGYGGGIRTTSTWGSLTGSCFNSSGTGSARTQPKTLFLCWCGWRIKCSILAALSAWRCTV